MISLDYGNKKKLALHDARGPRTCPKPPRGLSGHRKFAFILDDLLREDDVATESPTVGSSGVEPEMVRDIVAQAPHRLWLVPSRAVKNYKKDHGLPLDNKDDALAAEIIYKIATRPNAELKEWHYTPIVRCESCGTRLTGRKHKSVRPYDKRGYNDPVVTEFMGNLVPYYDLPPKMRKILGDGKEYQKSVVFPFAQAFDEAGARDSREVYEKIIGLYGHAFPSHYRRATIALMQSIAKKMTGAAKMEDITPEQRKEAWKETRRIIRDLYRWSVSPDENPNRQLTLF